MTPTSSGQLLGPRRPVIGPTPRVAPRCGASSLSGSPSHPRQNRLCSGIPRHLRPKPLVTRVSQLRPKPSLTRTSHARQAGRDSVSRPSRGRTAGESRPASPPASRLGLGLRPGTGRADPGTEARVRASRWYEHQEALELRRLGDAPLDRAGAPTPSTPSPGRRHELPRGADLRSSLIPDLPVVPPCGGPAGWIGGRVLCPASRRAQGVLRRKFDILLVPQIAPQEGHLAPQVDRFLHMRHPLAVEEYSGRSVGFGDHPATRSVSPSPTRR